MGKGGRESSQRELREANTGTGIRSGRQRAGADVDVGASDVEIGTMSSFYL
jgi:hypothetical protein